MQENNQGRQPEKQILPNEVHNATQDPASMKDPLQEQLEKSEGLNGPRETETLERLRQNNGGEQDSGK